MNPVWLITYENVDISDEVAPMVLSAEYTDNLEGKADELELTLDDSAGLWRTGWWPSSGDTLSVQMGYYGQPLLNAGTFKVDAPQLRGKPDTVTISALSAEQSSGLRSVQNRAFESLTLNDLVSRLAVELELTVIGDVPTLALGRVTQTETNLAFLRRLAKAYGYAFTIRPPNLIFYSIVQLEAADIVMSYDRTDLSAYDFKGSTQDTYVACEVTYFDAQLKANRTVRVEADNARKALILSSGGATTAVVFPSRTLREGLNGDDVRSWQTWVASKGHTLGTVDGKFGPKTRRATIAYQQKLGTKPDGLVGPETVRLAKEDGWGSSSASAGDAVRSEVTGRVLRKEIRVESIEQADAQARALLLAANRLKVTGSMSMSGDPCLVSGVTIQLNGMGRLTGKYLVQTSNHRVARSGGYTTSVEVTYV
jgi:phage protein D